MDDRIYLDVNPRLLNWGAWARGSVGGGSQGRCGSIEGHYIREKTDAEDHEQKSKKDGRTPVNVDDAERVEKAVLALKGERMRRLLVERYVNQRRKEEICRKLKMEWALYQASLLRCVYEVGKILHHQSFEEAIYRGRRITAGLPSTTSSRDCARVSAEAPDTGRQREPE